MTSFSNYFILANLPTRNLQKLVARHGDDLKIKLQDQSKEECGEDWAVC